MKQYSYGICPIMKINGYNYTLLNKTSKISQFNFFKGKIEDDESIEECAIREFYEETGVKINKEDLGDYYYQRSKKKNVGIFILDWEKYKTEEFDFQEKEIYSVSWVYLENIETSKNQQEIINEIEKDYK